LTIGDRRGEFPGMLANRTFHVVFVTANRGAGIVPGSPDKTLHYSGKQIVVSP
jgi:alpha-D-xyloside xylohydrolase